jgi:hypothetical protein
VPYELVEFLGLNTNAERVSPAVSVLEAEAAVRERQERPTIGTASLPSSSSPVLTHDERISHFAEQAERAYLNARARGVKHPSLAPETYMARSHLRDWQACKWRRESGFTVEEER